MIAIKIILIKIIKSQGVQVQALKTGMTSTEKQRSKHLISAPRL